jgi:putative transcriptional regulator
MMPIKLQNRIKELRKERKLKQSALASKVGVHQSEISVIETGERIPSIRLAGKIAKALKKSIEEVFSDLI